MVLKTMIWGRSRPCQQEASKDPDLSLVKEGVTNMEGNAPRHKPVTEVN